LQGGKYVDIHQTLGKPRAGRAPGAGRSHRGRYRASETAKEKPQKGKILSIGPGERDEDGDRIPMDVSVGDTVLFAKYAGTEIKVDGKKLLILKESDILAILV
jgi:co-chaperonin GroES (HSP10)